MDFEKSFGGVTHKLSIDASGIDICGNGHVNIDTSTSQILINCNHIDIDASTSVVGSFDVSYNEKYLDISKNLLQDGENIGGIIPLHGVIMWSGTGDPPDGWALCNGQNCLCNGTSFTTPNMSGRFIIGWSPETPKATAVREPQGSETYNITDNHMPLHDHPNMSVYFKLMFGKLSYHSYDKVDDKFKYNRFSEDEHAELLESYSLIDAKKSR